MSSGALVTAVGCRKGHVATSVPVSECLLIPGGFYFPCDGHIGWARLTGDLDRDRMELLGATRLEWLNRDLWGLYQLLAQERKRV